MKLDLWCENRVPVQLRIKLDTPSIEIVVLGIIRKEGDHYVVTSEKSHDTRYVLQPKMAGVSFNHDHPDTVTFGESGANSADGYKYRSYVWVSAAE